jgi:hypothetical protein
MPLAITKMKDYFRRIFLNPFSYFITSTTTQLHFMKYDQDIIIVVIDVIVIVAIAVAVLLVVIVVSPDN